ncbi:uncharacterized protein LOC125225563 [Leguminivora glycinivorella]|uniref:uncharacterized protein LOC125225563 n=1 Tax=Leguminivora glycinivorella TaxID=1035111 RepID=UPI00200E1081|nr:uncharacterized protein LOC125225563 [Leguminivora glycinivorella]
MVDVMSTEVGSSEAQNTPPNARKVPQGRRGPKAGTKRVHSNDEEVEPGNEPPKINSARRGRKAGGAGTAAPRLKLKMSGRGGRKAAGTYAGLAAARDKLRNSVEDEEDENPEEDGNCESEDRVSPRTDGDPIEAARWAAQTVLEQTERSSNINGGARNAINDACRVIKVAMEQLQSQRGSEEIRALRADNKRMREELALLKSETKALRKAFSERKTVASESLEEDPVVGPNEPINTRAEVETLFASFKEQMEKELFISIGGMVNAKLEGIRSRLPPEPILRPTLAADKKTGRGPNNAPAPSTLTSSQPRVNRGQPGGNPNEQTGATLMPPARPGPAPGPRIKETAAKPKPVNTAPTVTPPAHEEWTQVVKRRAKKKKKKATPPSTQTTQAAKSSGSVAKKLVIPKTAAVVVALKPEAKESYASVMLKATQAFRLEEVGLEHVNVRKTADGARILEVAGADSGRTADALKERLEAAIGDAARVYRPVKLARLRISGLDESATPEAVARAIAVKGGCSYADIRVGVIRFGYNGSGSVLAQCPIEAANVAASASRVTIGWSAARVEALEPEALRCYKCLGVGHTRATCPSPIDRGNLCFRCSKPGHRGADCQAEAFCAVCHKAKLPAGHRMGGFFCNPPKVRGVEAHSVSSGAPKTATPTVNISPTPTEQVIDGQQMDH